MRPMLRTAAPELARIQEPVRARLDRIGASLSQMVAGDFHLIDEVNDYLLLMRGKLFRPTLVLLSNEIGGKPSGDAEAIAAVVEAVHLATLVHDDAVDHSALRRGMPTVNSVWSHQVAIIMGDYVYSRSVMELASLNRVDLIEVLARAANAMTVGEMRQLSSHDSLDFSEKDYYRLIAAKTASLMSAACELGTMVGDPSHREPLRAYGFALGMAFQIADDILDYTEAEEVTGKTSGQDLREHKVTLPLIAALNDFNDEQRLALNALFGNPQPDDDSIMRVVDAVEVSGGIDYARSKAEAFAGEALAALESLPEGDGTRALAEAVAYAVDRRR